jgi:16S rRNA (guanine1207-N2)-methyltransferase
MAHPKADPAALVRRHGAGLPAPVLVLEVPDLAAAQTLAPEPGTGHLWFSTHRPTWEALQAGGYPVLPFGPWPRLPQGTIPNSALLFLPKSRERVRMTLVMASSAVEAGAPIWVVGTKEEGIGSATEALSDVAIPGPPESGKHARLLRGRSRGRSEATLETFVTQWTMAEEGTSGPARLIASLPGVFSHGRLDDGSALLLRTVPTLTGPLLDVGAGAGVLGLTYGLRGAAPVTLVEADALAVEAARRTLALHGLEGSVLAGDVFPSSNSGAPRFASIVSNPPFHQGVAIHHGVTARLVAEAPDWLETGGSLTLVCNRFLPVQDLLDRAFGEHRVLADDGRYRVYQAVNRPAARP